LATTKELNSKLSIPLLEEQISDLRR